MMFQTKYPVQDRSFARSEKLYLTLGWVLITLPSSFTVNGLFLEKNQHPNFLVFTILDPEDNIYCHSLGKFFVRMAEFLQIIFPFP